MARMKKPHVATLAEITIVKNGDYAEIAYHDPKCGWRQFEDRP